MCGKPTASRAPAAIDLNARETLSRGFSSQGFASGVLRQGFCDSGRAEALQILVTSARFSGVTLRHTPAELLDNCCDYVCFFWPCLWWRDAGLWLASVCSNSPL